MIKKYRLPIGELFNFFGSSNFKINEELEIKRVLNIKSPAKKFVPINFLIKKIGNIYRYSYDGGEITCDEKHLVKSNGDFKHICDVSEIDTIYGTKKILKVEFVKTGEVFDMSLDAPNEYITSEGVICHNTTIAKMLAKSIPCDFMYINASDERKLDDIRDKVSGFASTLGFQDKKILVLDECDQITPAGQMALRNLMETFAEHTRFILTCNYHEKLIEPLVSRCQVFHVHPPSKVEVAKHVAKILERENVTYEPADFKVLMKYYPDIRRIIQTAQQNSVGGKLSIDNNQVVESDAKIKLLEILKAGTSNKDKLQQCRKLLLDSGIGDYSEYFDYLYENVDDFAKGSVSAVILQLAEYQYKDTFVPNKEINFAACLIEILKAL